MKRLTFLTILVFGLWACNGKTNESPNVPTSDIAAEDTKYSTVVLNFDGMTVVDSSDWVLYPLTVREIEKNEKVFKSSGYGYRERTYWNIAFYNTETKETRLLSESLKMVIHSVIPHSNKNEKRIYYTITTTDYYQDGKLSTGDPKYLFVSDLSGKNFKQISPENYDLSSWNIIHRTNKILMRTTLDSDKDGKVDEIVDFVYDIEKQTIEQVFNPTFILKTKKLLEQQWTKK
jgi:hypothetical protein